MIIEIPKVSPEGSRYVGEMPVEILGLEPEKGIAPESIDYDVEARIVSRELMVSGQISMPVRLQCSLCAVFFSTFIQISSFLRVYPLHEGQIEVDISDDLREDLLLDLPTHPRCREDCAGLCPQCGANRNETSCSCSPEVGGGPWDSLDRLLGRAEL